jgi:hypothetical protein
MIQISTTLDNLPKLGLGQLTDFQGNLKDLRDVDLHKMIASFLIEGFFVPFYVWNDGETNWILDGHQRLRTLTYLEKNGIYAKMQGESVEISNTQKKGYSKVIVPDQFPVVYIDSKDTKNAKEKLLLINSQYGQITKDGFDEFTVDLEKDFFNITSGFEGFFDIEKLQDNDDLIEQLKPTESDSYILTVECISEDEQNKLKNKLKKDGYKVTIKQ